MQIPPSPAIQIITFAIWAAATLYLINKGGRNNGIFRIVVTTGYRLIIAGAVSAAIIGAAASGDSKILTDAAIQFILVLSAGVGGSYIAHANMSLRDFPNKLDGPETLSGFRVSKPGDTAQRQGVTRSKNKK